MKKKYISGFIAIVMFAGGWWIYNLVWGKPLNINHFYDRVFIEYALDDPELLSQLGIVDNTILDFHSDDLTDASPDYTQKLARKARKDLQTLQGYDREKQTKAQQLSTDILEWFLDDAVRGEEFMYHNYPINQFLGVQSSLPSFMDATHQIKDKKSAENYISRLSKFGNKFDQVIEGLRLREDKNIIPPKFVIKKVLFEMRNFIAQPLEENILCKSFRTKLEKITDLDEKEKLRLFEAVQQEIEQTVYPAYQNLINYFEGLELKATTDDGVWKLPDGQACYAYQLRNKTTSDYTPEEVHQIGLTEAARIQAEMDQILKSLGYKGGTVAERMRQLAQEDRFLFADDEAGRELVLKEYQEIIDEIDQDLDEVFNLRPRLGVEVRRVPEFKEKTSPLAYYNPPALDGSRPGVFYANLRSVKEIARFRMRSLAYHEAIPGHHFQLAIQQELQDMPIFRTVVRFIAYVEGWALYAERLTWEYGFQSNPYSNLGRMQYDLIRSARLVVDTGIHYKRWTREEAIKYMLENTGMPEDYVVTEIERYIVDPGQACAYKIGMLKILELREKAKQKFGDEFDIREFHDVVLKNGALPLGILEQVVVSYMESKTSS